MSNPKARAGLIRLRQWTVDDIRKRIGVLLAERAAVEQAQTDLEVRVVTEQEAIRRQASSPDDLQAIESGSFAYGAYAQRVIRDREAFARDLARLDDEIESVQAELREAFLDLKQLEIVEERDRERAAREAARREMTAYDEAALRGFMTQKKM